MNRITRLVRDCEVLFIQELTGALLLALTLSHACLVERSSLQEALLGNADEYRCLSAREFDLGSKTGPICSCVCDAESAADQTRNIRVKKTGTMSLMPSLPPVEHVTSASRKLAQRPAEGIPFYQYTLRTIPTQRFHLRRVCSRLPCYHASMFGPAAACKYRLLGCLPARDYVLM